MYNAHWGLKFRTWQVYVRAINNEISHIKISQLTHLNKGLDNWNIFSLINSSYQIIYMLYTARSLQLSLHLLPLSETPLPPAAPWNTCDFVSKFEYNLSFVVDPSTTRQGLISMPCKCGRTCVFEGGGGRSIAII